MAKTRGKTRTRRTSLLLLLTLFLACPAFAQKTVEIKNADELIYSEIGERKVRRLLGNVHLIHAGTDMRCDSAHHYSEENKIDAFGNVHISKGDGMSIMSDSLKYDGTTKTAVLLQNVRLTDNVMVLTTSRLDYDLDNDLAVYADSGHITDRKTVLTSKRGNYNSETKQSFFKERVRLTDPEYRLEADTLQFDHERETAIFHGPTNIYAEQNVIYCEGGWYNTASRSSLFTNNASLIGPEQMVKGDSLYYDQSTGAGWAKHNVFWADTVEQISITAGYARFNEKTENLLATISPIMTHVVDADSLHMGADTLISLLDTGGHRIFYAYYGVKLFKEDLQGSCDSIYYSYQDSVLHMYYDPILWSGESQMTADTIDLIMIDNKLHRIDMIRKAFMISRTDSLMYNQIKGKNTHGFFKESNLDRMLVKGNGQSLYYGQDDDKAYIGLNEVDCSNMMIYFSDAEVDRVHFLTKPEATFHPIQRIDPADHILEGFRWLDDRRPRSKRDLKR